MMRKLAIGITLLLLSVRGGETVSISAVSNGSLDADSTQVAPPTNPAASVQAVVPPPAPVAPASERALSANPLWAIPLAQLPNARPADLFTIPAAAAACGRARRCPESGRGGQTKRA
jgi:general secretion pathway protein N